MKHGKNNALLSLLWENYQTQEEAANAAKCTVSRGPDTKSLIVQPAVAARASRARS